MMLRVVAMFRRIMPAPFVIPAMEKVVLGEDRRVNVREAILEKVSVMHMPLSALS
jgi:hypothetical protein